MNAIEPSIQVQGAYQGSVPSGAASSGTISLTLQDAIERGVRFNLGSIGAGEAARQTRAQRLAAIAQLLPDFTGGVQETVEQINLAAQGLRISLPIPGFHFPTVVGPFNYFDARAYLRESLSLTGLHNLRSCRESVRSAELSIQDSRELIALAVSGSYLRLLASGARIETAKAQIETARAIYQQAVDRHQTGLNARIDVNRSLVELQTQQQRLTSLTNDFEKQKLALARLIGLPMAQAFTLADVPAAIEPAPPDIALMIQQAVASRPDVAAAAAQVKASESARKAAVAEYFPSVEVTADYGLIGVNPSQSHGTFSLTGAVRFPIFRSGRIEADIGQSEAALNQRKAELEDLKARAEQDVRDAGLDLAAASEQVRVAESNRGLAADTLVQARDRFRAGVSDTVEVVQAEESVAVAEQDYISALYALNLARMSMARAAGQTEQGIRQLFPRK